MGGEAKFGQQGRGSVEGRQTVVSQVGHGQEQLGQGEAEEHLGQALPEQLQEQQETVVQGEVAQTVFIWVDVQVGPPITTLLET